MKDDNLAKDLRELITVLEGYDIKPFLWAGTLLGAVRERTFIGSDDDIDLAYISKYSHPRDVMQEAINLYTRLNNDGILRNYYTDRWIRTEETPITSTFGQAHIKINRSFTVDLFTTWVSEGEFHDPWFDVIGTENQFVYKDNCEELDGIKFPALENPERMLNVLYGDDWKTPRQEKGTVRNQFRHALRLACEKQNG